MTDIPGAYTRTPDGYSSKSGHPTTTSLGRPHLRIEGATIPAMPAPGYQECMRPLLEALSDGRKKNVREAKEVKQRIERE